MIIDGNCFFRALSTCLHGHQRNHMALRVSIAQYLNQQAEAAASEDRYILNQHAADIACNGIGLVKIYCRQQQTFCKVKVYLSTDVSSPLSYNPKIPPSEDKPLLSIAFFDPGHYMAVANNLNINDEIVLNGINKTALIAEQSNYSVDAMHSISSSSTNISFETGNAYQEKVFVRIVKTIVLNVYFLMHVA